MLRTHTTREGLIILQNKSKACWITSRGTDASFPVHAGVGTLGIERRRSKISVASGDTRARIHVYKQINKKKTEKFLGHFTVMAQNKLEKKNIPRHPKKPEPTVIMESPS
jgi:hypothetical protein